MEQITEKQIDFKRINNDINGNPRYIVHFLNFINDKDDEQIKQDFAASLSINPFKLTGFKFDLALERARKIGGKKYRGMDYGGGIVFQSYSLPELTRAINELMSKY